MSDWGKIYESTNFGEPEYTARSLYNEGTPDGFQITEMYNLLRTIQTTAGIIAERVDNQFASVFELYDVPNTTSGGQGPQTPFTGLLDTYTGGIRAYSSLQMSASAQESQRTRRSSNNDEQDIGFNSDNDLDTTALTTFVNADVDTYTSDFSSDDDNFNALNGTDVGQQSILGVDDAYKLTLSGGNAAHIAEKGVIYQYGNSYTVSFDYYIPSGQTVTGLIAPIQSGNTGSTLLNVTGSWQSVSVNIVVRDEGVGNSNDRKMRFYAHNGTTITFAADDDVFYLKNIVVTQTTADGAVTTLYDQVANDTASATNAVNTLAIEQPLIVDGGSVIANNAIDFDGDRQVLVASNIGTTEGSLTIDLALNITDVTTRQAVFLTATDYNDRFGVTIEGGRIYIERYSGSYTGARVEDLATGFQRWTFVWESNALTTAYLNGTSQTFSASPVGWLGSFNTTLAIGDCRNTTFGTHPFKGDIHSLVIFNEAHGQAQATAFNDLFT